MTFYIRRTLQGKCKFPSSQKMLWAVMLWQQCYELLQSDNDYHPAYSWGFGFLLMSLPRVQKASMLNQSIIHRRKEGNLLIELDCFATSHTGQSLSVWGIVNAYRSSWCRTLNNAKTCEDGSTTCSLILFSDIKNLQLCCCVSCHKFAAIRVCIQSPNLQIEFTSYYSTTYFSGNCPRENAL